MSLGDENDSRLTSDHVSREDTCVVEGATLTYTYDDLGQLAGFGYPKDPGNWSTKVNLDYTYDTLGWVKQRDDNGTGKPMNEYKEISVQSLVKKVEYRYCRTCAGNRTERIETDEYGDIIEWLRYEMEGLNHLRIDERYDSPSDGNAVIDDEDPFRVQRVYYNGPGQLGQIAKVKVWDYSGQNPTSTDYYYGYDILGNLSVISNSNGAEADQFEQDAFGNEVESRWTNPIGGISEHLTTKQYDVDLGLYYFNARWYEPVSGAFFSRDVSALRDTIYVKSSLYYGRSTPFYAYATNDPVNVTDPEGDKILFFAHFRLYVGGSVEICLSSSDGYIDVSFPSFGIGAGFGVKIDFQDCGCPLCTPCLSIGLKCYAALTDVLFFLQAQFGYSWNIPPLCGGTAPPPPGWYGDGDIGAALGIEVALGCGLNFHYNW